MIITIGGTPGSGKSTLAQKLATKLNYTRYYIGGMRREIARKHGMTLEELNKLGETEAWTDQEVDEYQKRLGQTKDNLVVEGRTSFFLIPHSLKIFVCVDESTAAKRIFNQLKRKPQVRNEAAGLSSYDAVLASIRERVRSDTIRYQKYYHVDVYNSKNYDFVLNTTNDTVAQSFQKLYTFVQRELAKKP